MPVPVLMSVPVSVDGSLMTCESAFLARGHARKTHTLLLSMSMSVFFVTVAVFFVTVLAVHVTFTAMAYELESYRVRELQSERVTE